MPHRSAYATSARVQLVVQVVSFGARRVAVALRAWWTAVGVGSRAATASSRLRRPESSRAPANSGDGSPRPSPSRAAGVGSICITPSNDGRTAAPGAGDWLLPYGVAVGVGSITPSATPHTGMCSAHTVPPDTT